MKYKHYPVKEAESDITTGHKKKYRITTINWTLATIRGKVHRDTVHKNEYVYNLRHLIEFIRNTDDVAEDVIDIQPLR